MDIFFKLQGLRKPRKLVIDLNHILYNILFNTFISQNYK